MVALAVLAVLVGIVLTRAHATPVPAFAHNDNHRLWSLEIAINHRVCGVYGYRDAGQLLERRLRDNPTDLHTPLLSLPASIAGSREQYCASATQAFAVNEISLMLTMDAILAVQPDATLADVGRALHALRLALLALPVVVLLRSGASFPFAVAAFCASVLVVSAVEEHRFYSVYPFMPVLVVVFPAVLALALHAGCDRHWIGRVMAAFGAGLSGAYVYNFRTSYLPLVAVALALFVLPGRRQNARARAWTGSAVALASIVAGFIAFQHWFVRSLPVDASAAPYTHHVIAHPLVLGLALPPNDFAKSRGIAWSDAAGLDLARTIDPSVQFMGPGYDLALFKYYVSVWRQHPREMVGLYFDKWRLAGSDIGSYRVPPLDGRAFRLVLFPWQLVRDGVLITIVLLAALAWVVFRGTPWPAGTRLLAESLIASAVLLLFETAAILAGFNITHQAALMLLLVLGSLAAYQVLVESAARRFVLSRR